MHSSGTDIARWLDRGRHALAEIGLPAMRESGLLPGRGEKFFPVIGYPPLTMFGPMDDGPLYEGFARRPNAPTAAYVHIPFCPTRCTFCHWITQTRSPGEAVDVYLDYLEREMALHQAHWGGPIPVTSVLVGGGTPTYLDARQTERFMTLFDRYFDRSACTQFSVEAEPGTLLGEDGLEKLRVWREHGVERISLGVQSFDDEVLKRMARAHRHADTLAAIEQIRRAGIPRIMIDLIYGYPGQTPAQWAGQLLQAVQLDIDGWQLYRLRVRPHGDRPGTILKIHERRAEQFPGADDLFLMKMLGVEISQAHGYREYQTRIFVRRPEQMSHYLLDWTSRLTDVVGVGVSAWSNLRGVFSLNVGDDSLSRYYAALDRGRIPIDRGKLRTPDDEARRSFILPLKNMAVDKAAYRARVGRDVHEVFGDEIAWLAGMDLLAEDDDFVRLTRRGRFFADEVCAQFFHPDYLPFPEVARAPARRLLQGRG